MKEYQQREAQMSKEEQEKQENYIQTQTFNNLTKDYEHVIHEVNAIISEQKNLERWTYKLHLGLVETLFR